MRAHQKRHHQKMVHKHRRPIHQLTTVPTTVKVEPIPIITEPVNITVPTAMTVHHTTTINGNSSTMLPIAGMVSGMLILAATMATAADTTDPMA